jgi:hypothetical protein
VFVEKSVAEALAIPLPASAECLIDREDMRSKQTEIGNTNAAIIKTGFEDTPLPFTSH